MKKTKKQNIKFKISSARVFIFLVLSFLVLLSLIWQNSIEQLINTGYSNNSGILDEQGLQVHFVNIGQGDGILIELPDGKTMIVDAGPSGSASKLLDYIENNIFENTQEKVFDYMILTHSDTDHIGAADEVLDAYQINSVYRPEIYSNYIDPETEEEVEETPINRVNTSTQTYGKVIKRVLNEPNCTVIFSYEGLTITGGIGLDAYIFTFYSPSEHSYTDVNDFSPIITLQYRNQAVLLTGDASIENEEEVLSKYTLPQIDVLKLGHHGSNTSTGEALLSNTNVTYAIISVGENNYGHPNEETINRLVYSGVNKNNILSTITNGNILVNITKEEDILIFTEVESLPIYIEWEYVVISIILFLFVTTFNINIKNN